MVLDIMPYKVSVSVRSDIGLVRPNNEDAFEQVVEDNFFVVADGMGGHKAGEVASKQAVTNACRLFLEKLHPIAEVTLEYAQQTLVAIIKEINTIIYKMAAGKEALRGMGTTLCCLLVHPKGLVYSHVGDSRIYRLRDGKLKQLTKDHSLLRELLELGQLNEQQADEFAYKNIITKAIGTEPCIEPVAEVDTIQDGDVLLICTDGLTDLLSREEIEQVLKKTPARDRADRLIQIAKQRGGHDNITVAIVKIES